jgi:hypothetical protein
MQLLESLVLSGRIIDIALSVMLIELLVLYALHRRGRLAIDIRGAVYNLGAGGSLALAIRASLTNSGFLLISVFLLSALVFHGLDTQRRIQLKH